MKNLKPIHDVSPRVNSIKFLNSTKPILNTSTVHFNSPKKNGFPLWHQTKHWYLSQIKVFADLPEEDKQELREISCMVSYPKGHILSLPGQPGDIIFLLKEGKIKISQISEEGQEATLCLLKPGEVFGEVEALAGVPRETMVQALEPILVCEIKRDNFFRFLDRCPTVAIRILKKVGGQLRYVESKFTDMVFCSAPTRLAKLLVQLSDSMGETQGERIRLNIRLTHQNLANLIGTTRETASSILIQFQNQGLVLQEKRTLFLLDLEGLAKIR